MKKSTRSNLTSPLIPPTWQNLCTITFSLLAATPAVQAASATWSATPADNVWSNTGNWSANPVPGVGDTATFSGASTITTINTGTISLTTLAFTSTTAYTIGTSAGTGQITFADGPTAAVSITGQANVIINSNIILGTAAASTTSFGTGNNRNLTLAGSITVGTGGTPGAKTLAIAPFNSAPSSVTLSGAITDNANSPLTLTKTGPSTLTLSNASNSFTGGFSAGSGQTNVSSLAALGSATTGLITLGTGNQAAAILNFTGSPGSLSRQVQIGISTAAGTGGATINNNATNGSTPLIFTNALFNAQVANSGVGNTRVLTLGGANTDTNEIQGIIRNNTGPGAPIAVTKADAGTWTLSGGTTGNTYTGATQVNGGILVFGKTLAKAGGTVTAAAAGSIGLGVGGTGFYSAANVDALFNTNTLSGFTLDNASGVAIDTTAGDFDQNVALTAARSLTKLGPNTLTLSQANTYNGATNVNRGKVIVTNSIGNSAVAVSGTGSILASGTTATIGSTLTVNNGAILAVGDAANATIATATVTNATTFNNGSIFSWDINAEGVSYDKLVTSSLVDGNATGGTIFRIVVADASFTQNFWDSTQTWNDIFTTNGTAATAISNWANVFGNSVSVVDSNFDSFTPSAGTFSISGSSLTWTAVPEPTSALAGLLLGAGLLRRRRL